MSAPTVITRAAVYLRDGGCVVCGTLRHLTFQHRARVGAGGDTRRPIPEEGLTACSIHNERFESDLQQAALAFGWKIRDWAEGKAFLVPVLHMPTRTWFRLSASERIVTTPTVAQDLMLDVYGDDWLEWKAEADRIFPPIEGRRYSWAR